jgi:hypothetical protein
LAVNFWSVTYFGVFNFGTSYLGAKIGQNKTMTKISRFTVLNNQTIDPSINQNQINNGKLSGISSQQSQLHHWPPDLNFGL